MKKSVVNKTWVWTLFWIFGFGWNIYNYNSDQITRFTSIKVKSLHEKVCNEKDKTCFPTFIKPESFQQTRFPQAIIIGAKKCGTRVLLSMLTAHPQVNSLLEEGHYFDDNVSYALGDNWYKSKMPQTTKDQITIEKTPSYLPIGFVPKRIYKFNSNIKLIALLRNPVDRLLSDHVQINQLRLSKNKSSLKKTGEEYIDQKLLQVRDKTPVKIGRYVEHVKNWLKYFKSDQLLILNGDDFVKDPLPVLQNLEIFLNLKPHFTSKNVFFNATRGFYCWLTENGPTCAGKEKGRIHPKISMKDRTILENYYQPYNEELFKLIGKQFYW